MKRKTLSKLYNARQILILAHIDDTHKPTQKKLARVINRITKVIKNP